MPSVPADMIVVNPIEIATSYNEGFIDGKTHILDEILDIVENADGRTEAYEELMEFVNEKKKEIDSL